MEKSKMLRYGSASVMALVNAILMAGGARAADTASSGTTKNGEVIKCITFSSDSVSV